jgi:hypothetical protein
LGAFFPDQKLRRNAISPASLISERQKQDDEDGDSFFRHALRMGWSRQRTSRPDCPMNKQIVYLATHSEINHTTGVEFKMVDTVATSQLLTK